MSKVNLIQWLFRSLWGAIDNIIDEMMKFIFKPNKIIPYQLLTIIIAAWVSNWDNATHRTIAFTIFLGVQGLVWSGFHGREIEQNAKFKDRQDQLRKVFADLEAEKERMQAIINALKRLIFTILKMLKPKYENFYKLELRKILYGKEEKTNIGGDEHGQTERG